MVEGRAPLDFIAPVTALPGVGAKRAEILGRLGIASVEDLLRHYPVRYEDRRKPVSSSKLKDGEPALARVRVLRIIRAPAYVRGGAGGGRAGRIPMKVVCSDESGELTLLFFNARWLSGAFTEGAEYWVYGTPRRDLAGVSMAHPDFEPASAGEGADDAQGSAAGPGIVPVYPLTAGVSQRNIRSLVRAALHAAEQAPENLPKELTEERRLAPLSYALWHIHFPEDEHALNAARYRLVYEEFFMLQARLLYRRSVTGAGAEGKRTCAAAFSADDAAGLFPYELTKAQQRSIEEIRSDMAGSTQMNRLLQGDVGSGKTAVAAASAMFAAKSGFQSVIMAPTEILAAQHYEEFSRIFGETGIRIALLTSGLTPRQKNEVKEGLRNGETDIAIGTHALLEPDVAFIRLGLVVTDEQHRFGVQQRLTLREKGGAPDTLVMTATPIPRTLALMLYADLEVSVLDEMPPGRKAVSTRFVDPDRRAAVYDFAEREMAEGRQVYVVAPKIGDDEEAEAEKQGDSEFDTMLSTALGLAEELALRFPHRRVEALHGRMKSGEKEDIMRAFSAGEIDMLVSTVVIEVGVNVPNATMMIVENAERFGLAQLHQLRGRVGRGAAKSYCVLISDSKSGLAVKRCETLAKENDGFRIAELDLTLRGPGDIFGVRQHGLPEFKIADPAKHMEILKKANHDAQRYAAQIGGALIESDCGGF